LYADAVARDAAVECARRLLEDPQVQAAVQTGAGGRLPIAGDLFCAVYQLFFARAVRTFLASVIAEKVKLLFPVLRVFDPAGLVADWVANKLLDVLPNPCERDQTHSTSSL